MSKSVAINANNLNAKQLIDAVTKRAEFDAREVVNARSKFNKHAVAIEFPAVKGKKKAEWMPTLVFMAHDIDGLTARLHLEEWEGEGYIETEYTNGAKLRKRIQKAAKKAGIKKKAVKDFTNFLDSLVG